MLIQLIRCDEIEVAAQFRETIDADAVADYAEAIDLLPPIDVFFSGTKPYYLGDGVHRLEAHRRAGEKKIKANVHSGGRLEAVLFAAGANNRHGIRRDGGYVRRAILAVLSMCPEKTDSEVAKICNCSRRYVVEIRNQHPPVQSNTRQVVRRETQYTQTRKAHHVNSSHDSSGDAKEPERTQEDVKQHDSVIRDMVGTQIDDAEIAAVFSRRGEIQELMTRVSQIKSKVMGAIDDEDELYSLIHPGEFQAECANLYRHLKFALPHAICPYCNGTGCKVCKNRGWVNEQTFTNFVPEDLKPRPAA